MSAPEVLPPGVYDIPEAEYFGARYALSCSGCKLLLPPSCPAKFRYQQEHAEYKRAFDVGHAAHRLVLGAGADFVVLDYDDYRTKAAQKARDEARAAGIAPVINPEYDRIKAMAAAIQAHPLASALFEPGTGDAEQSLFWDDPETGLPLRCRLDWFRPADPARSIITDYKTADSADPATFAKAAANYHYDMQDALYSDAVRALGLGDPAFLFVVQEKTPPYLVSVIELDDEARQAGRALNRRAIRIYERCAESGDWPGYVAKDETALIGLPAWARPREDHL